VAARSVNQTALENLSDDERRQLLALLGRAIEGLRVGRGGDG
jgi:hypothetical protein